MEKIISEKQEIIDRLRGKSAILNPKGQSLSVHSVLYDKTNLTAELLMLRGSKEHDDSYYLADSKTWQKAKIPIYQDKLDDLHRRFKDYQELRVKQGFPDTDIWPTELLKDKNELEARLEVANAEAKAIEKRLREIREKEDEIQDSQILKFGPTGSMHTYEDGRIKDLHGQRVEYIDDIPVIANGPYKGLAVSLYRTHIVEPWVEHQKAKKIKQLQLAQERAKLLGLPIPQQLGASAPMSVKPNELPSWPIIEGKPAKNWLRPEIARTK